MNGYSDKMMRPASQSVHAGAAGLQKGVVRIWTERGFGFVRPDNGSGDVFCHINQVLGDVDELRVGDRVKFEIGVNARTGRPEAKSVQVIDG